MRAQGISHLSVTTTQAVAVHENRVVLGLEGDHDLFSNII